MEESMKQKKMEKIFRFKFNIYLPFPKVNFISVPTEYFTVAGSVVNNDFILNYIRL